MALELSLDGTTPPNTRAAWFLEVDADVNGNYFVCGLPANRRRTRPPTRAASSGAAFSRYYR
jgi:hypothetical protein